MYNRQKIRVGVICLWITLLVLLWKGHESWARGIFAFIEYISFWLLLGAQHDVFHAPAGICLGIVCPRILCGINHTNQIATFVTVPYSYFFERKGQNWSCILMFVGNLLAAIVSLWFFPANEEIVIKAADFHHGMVGLLLILGLGTATMMLFNQVSYRLYEEVQLANQKLEANTKEKEAFFATISHEIRNPLQSLAGSVELLQDHGASQDSLLEICKNCCDTVLNLVSNILDMSKVAAGKMQFSPVPTDLREIVNKVFRISQARAGSKGVLLEMVDDPRLPTSVELDPQRVEQVVLNLVANAIKFTNRGKVVIKLQWFPMVPQIDSISEALSRSSWKEVMEISENTSGTASVRLLKKYRKAREPSSYRPQVSFSTPGPDPLPQNPQDNPEESAPEGVVKIEIMDTGIGVAKEAARNLFKAYQQADATISRNYGGTGLGLWISKNILLQMKGDIRVKSKIGKGSNFMLAFPAKVGAEIPQFSDTGEEEKRCELFTGKMALIVDDIPENTFLTKEVLAKYGMRATTTQNAAEAVEIYKDRKIDIIITDLRMPVMSGQTLILEVRKYEADNHRAKVPIIVVTAENSPDEKTRCLTRHGADEYLIKPIKYRDLVSAICRVLAHEKKQRAKKLLIVDDDVLSSRFIKAVLEQQGHTCTVKHSIEAAKKEFEEHSGEIDVVLADNLLGDGTGVDFVLFVTDWIRDGSLKMPVIISMSGNPVEDQKESYRGFQVTHFMQKPIKKQDLLDVIRVV